MSLGRLRVYSKVLFLKKCLGNIFQTRAYSIVYLLLIWLMVSEMLNQQWALIRRSFSQYLAYFRLKQDDCFEIRLIVSFQALLRLSDSFRILTSVMLISSLNAHFNLLGSFQAFRFILAHFELSGSKKFISSFDVHFELSCWFWAFESIFGALMMLSG